MKVTKTQILSLYRNILRDAKTKLTMTDKEYFKRRMRIEFTTKPKGFNEDMKSKMYNVISIFFSLSIFFILPLNISATQFKNLEMIFGISHQVFFGFLIFFTFSILPFSIIYYFVDSLSIRKPKDQILKKKIDLFSISSLNSTLYSVLISIPISSIFYFLLVLFYFVTRNLEISIKSFSTRVEFSTLDQAILCYENCRASPNTLIFTIEWVSIIPVFIGILDFIGWFYIFIFGGIGMFSFPFFMIFKIFNRKKRMTVENYKSKRETMMNVTMNLMEKGKDLKTKLEQGELDYLSFQNNKKLVEFALEVEKTEKKWRKIDLAFKKGGDSILFDLFSFIFGFLSLIFSILIIIQITATNLNPPSKSIH
eukprot:gene677-8178_t